MTGTGRPKDPPEAPEEDERVPAPHEDVDEVDVSSDESFPASDPPSWIGTRGG